MSIQRSVGNPQVRAPARPNPATCYHSPELKFDGRPVRGLAFNPRVLPPPSCSRRWTTPSMT
jgi:hypothetical protein